VSSVVADIFSQAARLNIDHSCRNGNVVRLPKGCEVILAGDVHGNRANLAKIIDYADIGSQPSRRLILQEIIHGSLDERTGQDRSVELLLRAARLKIAHYEKVIFLLGNHDIAQAEGNEIMKDGRSLCKTFEAGVAFAFGDQSGEVISAIKQFILSMPLAVQCPNGAFIAHSLPSPSGMQVSGTDILARPYSDEDMHRGGALYEWTWGRGQTTEQLDALAGELGVEFFLLGHQPTAAGVQLLNARAAIIESDHAHGCILHFPSDAPINADNVMSFARPIVAMKKNVATGAGESAN